MLFERSLKATVATAFAAVAVVVTACGPKEPDKPVDPVDPVNPGGGETVDPEPQTPTSTLKDISTFQLGEVFDLTFAGEQLLPYKGLSKGDYIEAETITGKAATYRFEVVSANDTDGAKLSCPEKWIGGMCRLTLHAGSTTRTLGETFVDVVDRYEVPKNARFSLYGRVIDSDGNGISGVSVSDGKGVVQTNENGFYYILSERKFGYVFISVPSGYRAAVNRSIPQFFRKVTSDITNYEIRSFVLEKEENTRHRLVVFTDVHMANRTEDKRQLTSGFKKDLASELERAKADGVPLYALSLGDLTWDEFWYSNKMEPKHYKELMADVEVPIYNLLGNHDNDPYVADDFKSEEPWRTYIGPTYYSFNIGDIHYVQLDNTLFTNAGGAQGTIGDLKYTEGFTADELAWLRSDLSFVPKSKKLVIGMHIQYTNRPRVTTGGGDTFSQSMPTDQSAKLLDLISGYDTQILTGHTHIRYTNFISDRLMEQNIAAICGTWWWCGYYSSYRTNMCRDGVPDGYEVFDYDGSSMTCYYKGVGKDKNYQFRAYDLNNCLIDRATYCPKIASNFKVVTEEIFKQYACGYDTPRSDNAVLINVFAWNTKYKVQVTETETGKNLYPRRISGYDPLHVIHFNMGRMNSNSKNLTFPTLLTDHLFEVNCSSPTSTLEIKVTDEFGNEYSETMTRPRKLLDMSKSTQW